MVALNVWVYPRRGDIMAFRGIVKYCNESVFGREDIMPFRGIVKNCKCDEPALGKGDIMPSEAY